MEGWVRDDVLEVVNQEPMSELENITTSQGDNVFDRPFVPRIHEGLDEQEKVAEAPPIDRFPSICAKFCFKGKDAFERGKFLQAANLYTHAIEAATTKRDRAMALGYRAGCYRRARKLDEAIADCDASLAAFPCHDEVLFRKAACFLEKSQPTRAVEVFEDLYRINRAYPHLLDWLVRAWALKRRQAKGMKLPTAWGSEGSQKEDISMETDHYKVLGVAVDATPAQLKRAYRLKSLQYHPDRPEGNNAAFQRINAAFEILSDCDKRASYDAGDDFSAKRKSNDDDYYEDDDEEGESVRDEITRKYFPERMKFWPFGDPFVRKRKLERARASRGYGKGERKRC